MDQQISRVERWGLLSGVTGCVANALLVGLYVSLGTGDHDFRWTGPANDVIGGVVSMGAGIPFVLAVTEIVDDPGVRKAARIAVAGQVAIAGSSVLLVTGVVPFEIQVFLAIPAITTVFVWAGLVGRTGRLPFSRAARLMGAGLVAGLTTLGVSLVLPSGSVAQYAVGGVGVAAALAAFLAYPVWQLKLSTSLRDALAVGPASPSPIEEVVR